MNGCILFDHIGCKQHFCLSQARKLGHYPEFCTLQSHIFSSFPHYHPFIMKKSLCPCCPDASNFDCNLLLIKNNNILFWIVTRRKWQYNYVQRKILVIDLLEDFGNDQPIEVFSGAMYFKTTKAFLLILYDRYILVKKYAYLWKKWLSLDLTRMGT